jgi:hypothetical protein
MNVGDYAQLTESGRISSVYWSEWIKQFLANSPRYKISAVIPYGESSCNYKLDGFNQAFDHAYFEPFKINYDTPCPFKVGDSVRLRNEPDFVPCGGVDKQSVLLAEQGLRPIVIENIDRASQKSTGGLVIWGNRYADWRRFEYADEPPKLAPLTVIGDVIRTKPGPIQDHLFDLGIDGTCKHYDDDGCCGAPRQQHEMLGTGLITRIFAKPQRKSVRHETRLWSPYGEVDLLCRDSE